MIRTLRPLRLSVRKWMHDTKEPSGNNRAGSRAPCHCERSEAISRLTNLHRLVMREIASLRSQ
jgi:hypothetical protein